MATGMVRMASSCSMCPTRCVTLSLMRNHYERYHKQDKNFHAVCQVRGCTSEYNNFEGYKTHLRRKHREILNAIIEEENDVPIRIGRIAPQVDAIDEEHDEQENILEIPRNEDNEEYEILDDQTVRRLNATLLIGTKETHKLTQRTVDAFMKNTTSIVENSIELLRGRLLSHLKNAGIEDPGLQDFFNHIISEDNIITNPFLGMETKSQQDSVFKELFGLVVSHNYLFPCFINMLLYNQSCACPSCIMLQ